MNEYVIVLRVNSLYVRNVDTNRIVAGPYPRPYGWARAATVCNALNPPPVWPRHATYQL
jgi:hypothetical protein